jgi:hypothetical protein
MYTRRYLESQIAVALGGRIAEELEFGENSVTTSASNDLQKATETATMMVRDFGMSDRLGQVPCCANMLVPQNERERREGGREKGRQGGRAGRKRGGGRGEGGANRARERERKRERERERDLGA